MFSDTMTINIKDEAGTLADYLSQGDPCASTHLAV